MNLNIQRIDKGISDIVGVLTDPIVVHPGGWGDTLPEWLKQGITIERLAMNLRALRGEEATGTDAEACAYLYTACLCFPLDHDWTNIYLYVTSQVYTRHRTKETGVEVPGDIRVEKLNDQEIMDLRRLKGWIYQKRTQARQERERAERRENRDAAAARRKAECPSLFDFCEVGKPDG